MTEFVSRSRNRNDDHVFMRLTGEKKSQYFEYYSKSTAYSNISILVDNGARL